MLSRLSPLIRAAALVLGAVLFLYAPASAQTKPASASPVASYADMMRRFNPHLAMSESRLFASEVLRDSLRVHLDPRFIMAIITVESHWDKRAISNVGALGLGQLMPSTAALLHVNPVSVRSNLEGTSDYLSRLVNRFSKSHDTYRKAIAGYNAGPMAVVRYGGVPPYAETQHYVVKVLRVWQQLKSRLGSTIVLANNVNPHKTMRIVVPAYWNPTTSAIAADALEPAAAASDAAQSATNTEQSAGAASGAPADGDSSAPVLQAQ